MSDLGRIWQTSGRCGVYTPIGTDRSDKPQIGRSKVWATLALMVTRNLTIGSLPACQIKMNPTEAIRIYDGDYYCRSCP